MTLLFEGSEWSFDMLASTLHECEKIGREELNLNLRRNQIEIITANQMLEAYTSHGMPVHYHHWSNGKSYLQQRQAYQGGYMGLAYEIVINSDPVIAYCMEENSAAMQALVIAHACVGHGAVFNMNYLFKEWTDPEGIIDYLVFARKYIQQCEDKYGIDAVEDTLDHAHSLRYASFDHYKRKPKLSAAKEQERRMRLLDKLESERSEFDHLFDYGSWRKLEVLTDPDKVDPEENLLYFIEKHSVILKDWQREILHIVRTIQQYFYPQIQTKTVNEGFATFTHHYILNRLYDKNLITAGALMECMTSHSQVVAQRAFNSMNPYAIGFAIFKDIQRICETPTAEDREWFPRLAGTDWREQVVFAMENFRDESFVLQYLSPKLMRDFRMLAITDDDKEEHLAVEQIHNDSGYERVRSVLARQYTLENMFPSIAVVDADMRGDRTLHLQHRTTNGSLLKDTEAMATLYHVQKLWGYNVVLTTVDENGKELEKMIVTPDD